MTQFADKAVLITGAAGGIGGAMCRYFAAKGARIGALDISDELPAITKELRAEGIVIEAAIADIANQEEVNAAIAKLQKAIGPADVLINNAGLSGASNLETTDGEIWRRDIAINLDGAYHCTSAVLGGMKERKTGAIVIIGSVNAFMSLGDPAYSAAKAGLVSYTKALAMEYGRFGIRANMVAPGTVKTPIWDHRVEKNPEIFESLLTWYPLRRVAMPEDIAAAAAFLASDSAAAISGAVLPVDCGLSAGNIVMSREITMLEF